MQITDILTQKISKLSTDRGSEKNTFILLEGTQQNPMLESKPLIFKLHKTKSLKEPNCH